MPETTTAGQKLAFRRQIEGIDDRNLSTIIIFIDFKNAFDTMHRDKLIENLWSFDLPVRAIEVVYTDTKATALFSLFSMFLPLYFLIFSLNY